jgi:hypothetical protein
LFEQAFYVGSPGENQQPAALGNSGAVCARDSKYFLFASFSAVRNPSSITG